MNAQYPITTTPTYNFSQVFQKIIELSENMLKAQQLESFNTFEMQPSLISVKEPTKLKPNYMETPVVAIDVSSIRLGETQTGTAIAVRGAIVWKHGNRYQYLRLGPFPFHTTESTAFPACFKHESIYVQTKLTSIFERWIQKTINQATKNSLILWDGSLTAGTSDTPTKMLKQILQETRENENTILAFSKMTRLLLYNRCITDYVLDSPFPCLLKIPVSPSYANQIHFLGDIFAVKLTRAGYAFRLDADKNQSYSQVVGAVERLLGNDLIGHGYPEALRLAHIFSTFTAIEVLGLQRYISKERQIEITSKPNLRRMLFGRFGKGMEG